ncbi:ABC transporter ATP-binding protein [Staphylococcus massiliensis]|uniref:ABC transporter ATP-binding protein n=1 Tax=Staphylococcus massiliensis S46 TaxID=1229783 RepID=K9B6L5_9STAP|nr:ATP-binding cassette domain-containing protein [Staphylococcus massiliensis]EKU50447.1 ABC transporter ATP-binding protein [Staphylococcus massiliensis S46]MCG3401344.1 ATP-binding cassette domain-containing protein [Staphylococcus massiliensis]MCG3411874.1 ATP-binding cassette domain-containing protein [Staphylococcus massiliensis]POA00478.1 ABC transporter ATP-binding protein [Staphylococcus massiliensis CCUG 55927]
MIKINHFTKIFNQRVLFHMLNMEITQGDFYIIRGASGSGKTTLINMLGLIEFPDSGTYTFEGEFINTRKQILNIKRKHFAYIYQNYGLLKNKTVQQNLALPLNVKYKDTQLMSDALETVGMSQAILKQKVVSLSGGEQQRIAIARALIKESTVIFADEPTGNLDEKTSDHIIDIFRDLNKRGKTIIMVTHDPKYFNIGTREYTINQTSCDATLN